MDAESEAESLFVAHFDRPGWSELPNPFGSPPRGDGKSKNKEKRGFRAHLAIVIIWVFPKK